MGLYIGFYACQVALPNRPVVVSVTLTRSTGRCRLSSFFFQASLLKRKSHGGSAWPL